MTKQGKSNLSSYGSALILVAETDPPLSEVREPHRSPPLIIESFKVLLCVLFILDLFPGEKREIALREVRLLFKPFADFMALPLIDEISLSNVP